MKKHIARREFLKVASRNLGILGVGSMIYDTVLIQLFQKAFAQTTATLNPTGYYIHMSLPGGPPRWMFDLPLAPQGITNSNFLQGSFGTVIEKNAMGNYLSRYSVDKHVIGGKTIHLPPVWNMKVAQPFTDLLQHTLFIRGMNMEINSHDLSNSRQVAPIIGGTSIHGAVADGSSRPIPGVIDGVSRASLAFKSKKGLSSNTLGTDSNPIATLLQPFQNYMASRSVHNPAMAPLQEQAFKQFEKYAAERGIASSALSEMYDSAIDLIGNDIYRISEKWPSTLKKYNDLIHEALHPNKGSLPGLFDKAISSQASTAFKGTDVKMVTLSDARDMITPTLSAGRMAANFAAAEILLDKVTASMSLGFSGLGGLESGTGSFNLGHDQHNAGNVVSTMMTTLFYRAFLASLTEYVEVLKTQGLFDKTVIHISAEFNRTPQTDGGGADHGVEASNTTLISGMLQKPAVIGNIQIADYNTRYKGTFGVSKPFGGLPRAIQVNDVARTITNMLRVDDIVTNANPLLKPSGNFWIPKTEEANNV